MPSRCARTSHLDDALLKGDNRFQIPTQHRFQTEASVVIPDAVIPGDSLSVSSGSNAGSELLYLTFHTAVTHKQAVFALDVDGAASIGAAVTAFLEGR